MRDFWKSQGPPLRIAALAIAASLGIDLLDASSDGPEAEYGSIEPMGGPSIAELAAKITPPRAGGDTSAASREIFEEMGLMGDA